MRGLRPIAAGLVAAGVIIILTGGSMELARTLLIAGLAYAVAYLVAERHGRR